MANFVLVTEPSMATSEPRSETRPRLSNAASRPAPRLKSVAPPMQRRRRLAKCRSHPATGLYKREDLPLCLASIGSSMMKQLHYSIPGPHSVSPAGLSWTSFWTISLRSAVLTCARSTLPMTWKAPRCLRATECSRRKSARSGSPLYKHYHPSANVSLSSHLQAPLPQQ